MAQSWWMDDREIVVGVISDTHGLLRPEAVAALAGSRFIVHAGDVGDAAILDRLRQIAPVHAVRGNVDVEPWARELPETTVVEAGGASLYVLHNIADLDLKPQAAGFAAVIFGHSHQPEIESRKGVLYFNPGSAGPRRFRLPVSLGRLRVRAGQLQPELITLPI